MTLIRCVGLLTALAFSVSACKREAPPAGADARVPTTTEAAPAAAPAVPTPATTGETQPAAVKAPPADAPTAGAAPAAGSSHYDEAKFAIEAKPSGPYAPGKEGAFEIVLDAKKPFHVNQQYPYKFKTKEGPGVKYAQPVVGKDQAKLEAQRVTMRVAFTPDGAGQRTLSGQFAFSVCTDETCLMEKRDLTLVVDVK
jgi:hypothetical protein